MKKKKIEFSKILVMWALVFTTLCVIVSFITTFQGQGGNEEVVVAVITTCVAIAVSYEAKSYGEKNSRNKYGINEDGSKSDVDENGFGG